MLFRKWFKPNRSTDREPKVEKLEAPIKPELDQSIQILQSIYEDCSDVVFRRFSIAGKIDALLIYIEGLSNNEEMDANVLAPLMKQATSGEFTRQHELLKHKIPVARVQEIDTFADCVEQISNGNPVILIAKEKQGFALGLAKSEKRSVQEPTSESVVRGPRDGFTETLGVNTALIRRKLKSPQLKMKSMKIGRYSQTQVVIAYMQNIAHHYLVAEVTERLQRIDMDAILESGYIEEMIEDTPFSPFPQILSTERPDVVVSSLLEGRVGILIDGTPVALVAPTTLYSLLQSSEDYYQRFWIGTSIRWLRYLFLLISLLLPSLYVAILTYHQEMVPTTLLISMAASREQVPFPALVEALFMEITFEALREAGIRLPKQVGAAVSIVGALVIGQAAVQAGMVSAPMVMVVAITGIASFTIPRYTAGIAFRMLRFPIMILAGTLGFLGVMIGILFILIHLCSLRSFGMPYLSPMAPMKGQDMKDVLLRVPWWMMDERPYSVDSNNLRRQALSQKSGPIHGDGEEE